MYDKKFRKKYGPNLPGNGSGLLALLKHIIVKRYLMKRNPKESAYLDTAWKTEVPIHVPDRKFNYLAIVYDGVVKEMIKVDDTTAKFLLGGASLIKYDPENTEVQKNMLFINSRFVKQPEKSSDAKPPKKS